MKSLNDRIATRAYFMYMNTGNQNELENWRKAEKIEKKNERRRRRYSDIQYQIRKQLEIQ